MQKGTVGGILCIVASVLGVLMLLPMLFYPVMMSDIIGDVESELGTSGDFEVFESVTDVMNAIVVGSFVFCLLLGALGVVGGIFAIRRKVWGLALTGSIVSSILFYPLGIVAVILVSMGHLEFRQPVLPASQPQGL